MTVSSSPPGRDHALHLLKVSGIGSVKVSRRYRPDNDSFISSKQLSESSDGCERPGESFGKSSTESRT